MSADAELYLMPETRCALYGHVMVEHEMLGRACARCGQFDPTWELHDGGAWWPSWVPLDFNGFA